MSAAQTPEPVAGDDWMALAEAVGVSVGPTRRVHPELAATHSPHPSRSRFFADTAMAAMLDDWAAEAADGCDPDAPIPFTVLCQSCGGTGLVAIKSWPSGHVWAVTCSLCGGGS